MEFINRCIVEPLEDRRHREASIVPRYVASLECYSKDVKHKRQLENSQSRPPRNWVVRRNVISRFTEQSRSRLKFTVANSEGLTTTFILTYPGEYPIDGSVVKKHWKALARYLSRKGFRGIYVKEFQERGAIHIHVLANGRVDERALREKWHQIVGSGDPNHLKYGVKGIKPIQKTMEAVADYYAKSESKAVPEGFTSIGKIWGVFGGFSIVPQLIVKGSREEIAPIARVCRNLENANRRRNQVKQRGRDNGRYGRIFYGVSEAVQKALPRLLQLFPIVSAQTTSASEQRDGGVAEFPVSLLGSLPLRNRAMSVRSSGAGFPQVSVSRVVSRECDTPSLENRSFSGLLIAGPRSIRRRIWLDLTPKYG